MRSRQIAAGIGGVSLFLLAVYMLYQGGTRIYYDYYFFAQVKEHYIPPDTKQRVEDTLMVLLLMLALYVAFRLMKYSFARR